MRWDALGSLATVESFLSELGCGLLSIENTETMDTGWSKPVATMVASDRPHGFLLFEKDPLCRG